jgi:predicted regulator of Ras-like GTPase activity (Roadblock/LC7/MglB family)
MYNILGDLNKTSGIQGSMLVGSDGIIIAADLDESLEDETVGASPSTVERVVPSSTAPSRGKPGLRRKNRGF